MSGFDVDPDLAADFNSTLEERVADAPYEQETPTAPPEAEAPATPERVRDEQGRFATAPEPDPEPQAEVEDTGDVTARRLAEKDQMIGRLGQELGELRQRFDQSQQPPPIDLTGADEIVFESPEHAQGLALEALRQGNTVAYDRIVRSWYDVDPVAANRLDAWVVQQQAQQQIAPQMQQVEAFVTRQKLEHTVTEALTKHPDIGDVLSPAVLDTIEIPPLLLRAMENPDQFGEALESLYLVAKGQLASRAATANGQAAEQTTIQAEKDKAQAMVASASSHTVSEGTGDPLLDSINNAFETHANSPFGI